MSLSIAIIADTHLNKSTYGQVKDKENSSLPFRTVDFMKSFEYCVDKAIENKPDILVSVGDSFDTHSPSNDVSGFFNSQIKKLLDNNIKVILMVGNHDVCKKHHALVPLKELGIKSIQVIDEPTTINMKDYNLFFFPYSLDIEQDRITTKKQFTEFIKTIDKTQKDKNIFFGHFGVRGATINQYTDKTNKLITEQSIKRMAKSNFRNDDSEDISIEDLDEIGASYIFLGDYHKHQVLPTKNCKAMYVGSIEKTDINEAGQKKGFVFFNSSMASSEKMGTSYFVEYPNCRPFVELRGNWTQIKNLSKGINEESNGAIVKIVFEGDKSELVEFNANIQGLKDWLKKKIDPVHIICDQEVRDDKMQKEATELENQILQKGQICDNDILLVAMEMINETENDEQEREQLRQMANNIYDKITTKSK